jgi:Dolichyl-phosphate-mannose-protein mannosyltransferase
MTCGTSNIWPKQRLTATREWVGILVLLTVIATFQLATLRSGHGWGDDFAMYLAHARNLAQGLPYADTGFIPNAYNVPGPPSYPPVYPLLLTPIYWAFGLDLTAVKVQTVLLLCAALAFIYGCVRTELPAAWASALLAVVGFNPWLWELKDEVLSDIPFLLFCFLTLYLGQRVARSPPSSVWRAYVRGAVLGVAAYLAYGTRSVGLVLLPALLLAETIRSRRITPFGVALISVFAALWFLQNLLLHTDQQYGQSLTLDPNWLAYNAVMYFRSLSLLWINGHSTPLRAAVFGLVLLLAAVGYVLQIRRAVGVLEIFPWLYLAPLLVYWVGTMIQQRYVLPLLPLMLYYAAIGLRALVQGRSLRMRQAVPAVLVAMMASLYAVRYSTLDFGPIRDGLSKSTTIALLDFVRVESAPNDVFLFGKPRLLALYTGRRSASQYGQRTDQQLWAYLRKVHAQYVIVARTQELSLEIDYGRPQQLSGFVSRFPERFLAVFTNADFVVYRIERS